MNACSFYTAQDDFRDSDKSKRVFKQMKYVTSDIKAEVQRLTQAPYRLRSLAITEAFTKRHLSTLNGHMF